MYNCCESFFAVSAAEFKERSGNVNVFLDNIAYVFLKSLLRSMAELWQFFVFSQFTQSFWSGGTPTLTCST